MQFSRAVRGGKYVVVLTAALALTACAKNAADEAAEGGLAGRGAGAGGGYGRNGGVDRNGVASPGSPAEFKTAIGDRVFFETDSTELTATAQATLDKQAEWLNQYGRYAFTVEGHADERGTREYNFALGARRAEVAKNYLISKGVTASRIRTASFGKERPVAVCDDISCWSQNRRAVTLLHGGNS